MSINRDSLNESLYSQDEFYDYENIKKRRNIFCSLKRNEIFVDFQEAQKGTTNYLNQSLGNCYLLDYQNNLSINQVSKQFNMMIHNSEVNNKDFELDENYFDELLQLNKEDSDSQLDNFNGLKETISNKSLFKQYNPIFDIKLSRYDSQNLMINEDYYSNRTDIFKEDYFILHQIGRIKKIASSSFISLSSISQDLSFSQQDFLSSTFSMCEESQEYENTLDKQLIVPIQRKYQAIFITKKIRKRNIKVATKNLQNESKNVVINNIIGIKENLARLLHLQIINQINEKCYLRSTQNKLSLILGNSIKQQKKQNLNVQSGNNNYSKCNPRTKEEIKKFVRELIFQNSIPIPSQVV